MRTKRETQVYVILYWEDTVVGDFYDEKILLAVPHVQTSSIPGKIMSWDYWKYTVLGDFTGS